MQTSVGERLREVRVLLGYSQEAFGLRAGVGKATQSNYERNERVPDATYLAAISQVGVDVMYVLTGQTHENLARTPVEVTLLTRLRKMTCKEQQALVLAAGVLSEEIPVPGE